MKIDHNARRESTGHGDGSPAPDASGGAPDDCNGRAKPKPPYPVMPNHEFEDFTAKIRKIAPKDRPAEKDAWLDAWLECASRNPRARNLGAVYFAFVMHVIWNTGCAEVGLETIAKDVGCDKRRVTRALRELVKMGLIGVQHRHGKGGYQIRSRYVPLRGAKARKMGDATPAVPGCHSSRPGDATSAVPRDATSAVPSTLVSSFEHISIEQPQQPSARSGPCPRRRSLKVKAGEPAFNTWIDKMRDSDRHDMANAAIAKGEMFVDALWPEKANYWPEIEGWKPTRNAVGPDR
jgi:hypothetical protein